MVIGLIMSGIYPEYFFIKINENSFEQGRLTISKMEGSQYMLEVDIVQSDSHKILSHVGVFLKIDSLLEAKELGRQKILEFVSHSFDGVAR